VNGTGSGLRLMLCSVNGVELVGNFIIQLDIIV
jgi:hypothetical protein